MNRLEHVRVDGTLCRHPAPAAMLRFAGGCLLCGHCGAELPEVLHHAVIRCDGSVVRVEQAAFGTLHVCGEDTAEQSIETLLRVTSLT